MQQNLVGLLLVINWSVTILVSLVIPLLHKKKIYQALLLKRIIVIPNNSTSYDAIIPFIQKQTNAMKDVIGEILWQMYGKEWHCYYDATPSQLLDALLVATGKATI